MAAQVNLKKGSGMTTQPVASEASAGWAERDFQAWVQEHARKLMLAGAAVLMVVAGVWLFIQSSRRKEVFASQALSQARSSAEAGNLPLAASDLSRLIERFGGTRAANEAVILLNQIRLLQDQIDPAVTSLREFVRSGPPDHVKAAALGLLGGGLEQQRKFAEASRAYREAAEAAPLDFLKAQYLLDAGRAATLAGDSAQARSSYDVVLREYGDLAQAAEARVRMAELGGEVPPLRSRAEARQ
jgi:outer membrane protein assembly factor BamD (BamD/ComL family)